jgi:hypothetical protein
MRLENYLKEAHGGSYGTYGTGRTKHLSREEFYKELKNYSDMANYYLKGGVLFMRGVKRSAAGEFGHVVPIESKRESAYTSNYYTLISSYDSSWNGIPPRDRSIVGSTDYDKASGYAGGGQSDGFYVVLPKNGSVIGEADAVDFWMTFKHIFGDSYYPLGRLNDDITRIFKVIGQGVSDDSLSSLKKACKAVDKALKVIYNW